MGPQTMLAAEKAKAALKQMDRRTLGMPANPLFKKVMVIGKRIECKCVWKDKRTFRRIYKSPAGQTFSEQGLEYVLEQMVDFLDKHFPNDDFRMVQIGPAAYNFIWDKERQAAEIAAPSTEPEIDALAK